MSSSLWAKILGWTQFGLTTAGQIGQSGTAPHGVWGWFGLVASLATAVAVHHASNTDGSK